GQTNGFDTKITVGGVSIADDVARCGHGQHRILSFNASAIVEQYRLSDLVRPVFNAKRVRWAHDGLCAPRSTAGWSDLDCGILVRGCISSQDPGSAVGACIIGGDKYVCTLGLIDDGITACRSSRNTATSREDPR